MDMTLQMWKNSLDKGQTVDLQVTGDLLEPTLSKGDAVTVRKVPFADLKLSDIVLCNVKGKVALRKIASTRQVYGVRCMEVLDTGGATHYIQDSTVMGKVVSMRRRNGMVHAPLTPAANVLRAIKRVLFPGTT